MGFKSLSSRPFTAERFSSFFRFRRPQLTYPGRSSNYLYCLNEKNKKKENGFKLPFPKLGSASFIGCAQELMTTNESVYFVR